MQIARVDFPGQRERRGRDRGTGCPHPNDDKVVGVLSLIGKNQSVRRFRDREFCSGKLEQWEIGEVVGTTTSPVSVNC